MAEKSGAETILNPITDRILCGAFNVSNGLGPGFLEKVYENALAHELRKTGLRVNQQHPLTVYYDGVPVGQFVADLLVESLVLVELKAVKILEDCHTAQCLNYLAATHLPICLLLNFGRPRVEIRRLAGPHLHLCSSVSICGQKPSGISERPEKELPERRSGS